MKTLMIAAHHALRAVTHEPKRKTAFTLAALMIEAHAAHGQPFPVPRKKIAELCPAHFENDNRVRDAIELLRSTSIIVKHDDDRYVFALAPEATHPPHSTPEGGIGVVGGLGALGDAAAILRQAALKPTDKRKAEWVCSPEQLAANIAASARLNPKPQPYDSTVKGDTTQEERAEIVRRIKGTVLPDLYSLETEEQIAEVKAAAVARLVEIADEIAANPLKLGNRLRQVLGARGLLRKVSAKMVRASPVRNVLEAVAAMPERRRAPPPIEKIVRDAPTAEEVIRQVDAAPIVAETRVVEQSWSSLRAPKLKQIASETYEGRLRAA